MARSTEPYAAEKVRTLCASPDELRARWADAGQRAFSLPASISFSASDGEKVAAGRMRCRRESGERAGVRCFFPQPSTPPLSNFCRRVIRAATPDQKLLCCAAENVESI
jgi:hypothetical protein